MATDRLQRMFDIGRWHAELISTLGTYITLANYCADSKAVQTHVEGIEFLSVDENGQEIPRPRSVAMDFTPHIHNDISTAISNYRCQMPVIVVSQLEGAILELFEALFFYRPELIRAFYAEDRPPEAERGISLELLIKASSLADLIDHVVTRAAAEAAAGKKKETVLRRLQRLTGAQMAAPVVDAFLDVVRIRNQVVHENLRVTVTDESVRGYIDAAMDLLAELGRVAMVAKIPYSDPGHLLED